jgi:hypothetical protein
METLQDIIAAYPNVDSVEQAAMFLSEICPRLLHGLSYLGAILPSPEAFAAIMLKRPDLHTRTRSSHRSGEFTGFWKQFPRAYVLLSTITAVLSQPSLTGSVNEFNAFPGQSEAALDQANLVLDGFKSVISRAALGHLTVKTTDESQTDAMTFLRDVDLIKTRNRPVLEATNIGSFCHSKNLQERLRDVFKPGCNTYVSLTS